MMPTTMTTTLKKQHGFSLIELMVTVAIVALLVGVAIPSYSKYMDRTRRLDAKAFLQEVAGEQIRYFSDNNVFATDMIELGYGGNATQDSPDGYYNISIANAVPTSFTLTATAITGKAQENDIKCGNFILDSTGLKGVTGTAGVDGCW
ncbi:MAG: type IV pilin protein [Granulosicoccaceae bacterium]